MISRKTYDILKKKYGTDLSSWTVWAESKSNSVKEGTDDVSIFETPEICSSLNNNYIFVGLNAGDHTKNYNPSKKKWTAFHSEVLKRSQDYKLRHALRDTRFWGSYITDVIKDFPDSDSIPVMKYLRNNPEFVKDNIKILLDEINILGNKDIVIIALGNNTYDILKKHLGDDFRIEKCMHFSYQINKDRYRERVLEALKNV